MNGKPVNIIDYGSHVGHYIGKNSDSHNISKSITDILSHTNYVLAKFGFCSADVKAKLFDSYCTNYYGSPLWALNNTEVNKFYVAWRKCIRRVWDLPNRTHNQLVPHIHNVLSIENQLLLRFVTFFYDVVHSSNSLVKLCGKLCIKSQSIVASNLRMVLHSVNNNRSLFYGRSKQMVKVLVEKKLKQSHNSQSIGDGLLIRELCRVRNSVMSCPLTVDEVLSSIVYLCTA